MFIIFLNIDAKPLKLIIKVFFTCYLFSFSSTSSAYDVGSRILATGGVTQIEGSAGSGIVPWAVLSGYGQKGEWGGDVFGTYANTDDYDLSVIGANVAIDNRVELSVATQILGIDAIARPLGLPDNELKQFVAGVKVRLFGDLIYTMLPQVSFGIQYKKNTDFDVPALTGAKDDHGVDFYLAATKLWLSGINGYPVLLNTVVRSTKANQLGLLGFGGDLDDSRSLMFEGSIGILLRRDLVLGMDYRQKPDNLSFAKEDDWMDFFLAWFPNKHLSITGAWTELGDIAGKTDQSGFYISLEGSF
mgnify:CR=1 FL=1|tara:strand:- start:15315 stop:16220 length:906 start_codon:yes stop_codon:yes gene_type:complete